jgi:hypothetical protein
MAEIDSSTSQLLFQLLDCGIRGDFAAIKQLPGAGNHREVMRLADRGLRVSTEFFGSLNTAEQVAMLKAVAAYEDTAGEMGMGSVTLLERLASLKSLRHGDPLWEAYAWILANTNSYWYYAGGMKSLDGFHGWQHMKYEIAAANESIDAERQAKDRARIAVKASGNLCNAVRRGDVKAVVALIALGADVESCCLDGKSVIDLAREKKRMDIEQILDATRSSVVAISDHPLEY